MPDPAIGYTTNYNIAKYADGDNPGATALNNNWDIIDTSIYSASQEVIAVNIPLQKSGNTVSLLYNTGNFKLSGSYLDTIQNIATSSSPRFASLDITSDAHVSGSLITSTVDNNAASALYLKAGNSWNDGGIIYFMNGGTAMAQMDPNGFIPNVYLKANDGNPPWTPGYAFVNAAGVGIGQVGGGSLAFYSNNAEQLRISSSGYVGIGTTIPIAKLDVSGSIRIKTNQENLIISASNTNNPLIRFHNSASGVDWAMSIGNPGNYSGWFKIGVDDVLNSWEMALNSGSGVNFTHQVSSPKFASSIYGLGDYAILEWVNSAYGYLYSGDLYLGANHPYGLRNISILLTPTAAVGYPSNSDAGYLCVKTTDDYWTDNPLLWIKNTGQIGINTKTPSERLTINGNISGSGNIYVLGNITGSNEKLSGNINVIGNITGSNERLTGYISASQAIINGNITGSNEKLSGYLSASEARITLITGSSELLTADINVIGNITGSNEKLTGNLSLYNGDVYQSGSVKLYNDKFTSGWAGSGWKLNQDLSSSLELDELTVRGTMRVYELLINQIRATNGTLFVSSVAKVSSSVSLGAGYYGVFFEAPEGNYCPFAASDILLSQRIDLDNTTVVDRVVGTVTAVNQNCATMSFATGIAKPGDVFARIGNVSNTARQGSIYLTSDDSEAPYIDVINDVSSYTDWTDKKKLKLRIGKLSGITDTRFGTLSNYGLYSQGGVYLISSQSDNSIALKVDSASAQLTMKQSNNTIFDFNTSASIAKIAGWTITSTELYNRNGGATYNEIKLFSSASDAYAIASTYASDVTPIDGKYVVLGKIPTGSIWYGQTGLVGRNSETDSTYFVLTNLSQSIAGWKFDKDKLYNGTNGNAILLDGTNKIISVNTGSVKMWHTSPTNYGISGSGFQLGSTNQIAGWNFNTASLYNGKSIELNSLTNTIGVYSSSVKMYYTSTASYGISGSGFSLGSTNEIASWSFDSNKFYKSGSFYFGGTSNDYLSTYSLPNTIVLGKYNSTSDRFIMRGNDQNTYVQMGIISNYPFFQIVSSSNTLISFTSTGNTIGGWNILSDKLYSGTTSSAIVLNNSNTNFIAVSGSGFEIYNPSDPKMFIGKKGGNFLEWNVASGSQLRISGSIIGSEFSTTDNFGWHGSGVFVQGNIVSSFNDYYSTNIDVDNISCNNVGNHAVLTINGGIPRLKMNGIQVVCTQSAAITDPASTTAANNTAIISILNALRNHGLIAT